MQYNYLLDIRLLHDLNCILTQKKTKDFFANYSITPKILRDVPVSGPNLQEATD